MSYFRPADTAQALEILANEEETLKPIAGCTDISVARQEKKLNCFSFLDLSYLNELRFLEERDGCIYLGPLVTHGEIAASKLILEKAPVLAAACITVGSPQIRNRGTVGGNICHASPSGDSTPALMVLDAEIKLESVNGERWVKAVNFFTGPGRTVRTDFELVTSLRFRPLTKEYKTGFIKLGQRKSLACSKVSVAFCGKLANGRLSDVRIAMGAVAPTVIRAHNTEKLLEGKEFNEALINEASDLISTEAAPIDDLRSTREYRINMVGVLLERILKEFLPVPVG